MLVYLIVYHPFVSINPSLESVNLWNTFPDPTFNVPIPAQDGTYMAETLTNDLDNME
uniref:Transposase n=2 Tax=Bursaphelenchus xylophilus TaxID=6326 RepID=A0A1I7SPH4_BURXY